MFILPKKFYTQNFGMVLALIICLYSTQSYADVCFLPLGGCVAGDALSAPENCAGYSTQKKNGQGWNCATCNANGHTYYKCEEKTCGAGYTAGIESCARGFTHEYEKDAGGKYVYSGDKKCGKCTTPDGCADGTQLSPVCEQSGFKPVETQNYKGAQVCYACLDDNCYGGKRKYCSWSSGSKSGPSGSVRAKSKEWYTSTARTKYGSTCYQCCDNVCSRGSQEVTSCNPNTELLRTLEHTKCGSACNECCNNVCSVGSLSSSCPSGYYSTTSGSTKCGNTCYSCVDCGGYKSKPNGCYSCTSRSCGGETRYDCTVLSDSCPSGSSQNPSCDYGKTEVGTTDCGHTCYTCDECTDTCSKHGWKDSSGECSYGSTTRTDDCGNTCYECGEYEEITCTGGYTSLSACNSAMGSYSYNHKCFGPDSGCYYLYCDDSKGYYDDDQMCDMETGGPCEEQGHCFVKSSGSGGGDGGDCGCDCDVGVPYTGQNCDSIDGSVGHNSCTGWRCDCCINPH